MKILIIDWDDTIFPTTYELNYVKDGLSTVEKHYQFTRNIKRIENVVINFFNKVTNKANEYLINKIYIVTNASSQWVNMCKVKHYKELSKYFSDPEFDAKLQIISGHALYSGDKVLCNNVPLWKYNIYKQIIESNTMIDANNVMETIEIIHISDYIVDHECMNRLKLEQKHCLIKNVKLPDFPNPYQLIENFELMTYSFDDLIKFNSSDEQQINELIFYNNSIKRDIVIIGAGVAGYSAALIFDTFGIRPLIIGKKSNHIMMCPMLYNYPGIVKTMTGSDFYNIIDKQIYDCNIRFIEEFVTHIKKTDGNTFMIKLQNEMNVECKIILIASGLTYITPKIDQIEKFIERCVFGCLSCCDIPKILNMNKNAYSAYSTTYVIVIGGGDSAFETALTLANDNSDRRITIICRSAIKAKKMLVDQTKNEKNMKKIKILEHKEIIKIISRNDRDTGTKNKIDYLILNDGTQILCDMIFCAIGHKPSIDFLSELNIATTEKGYIETEHNSTESSIKNIFACGSVVTDKYVNTVSVLGGGAMAASDIITSLQHS